MTDTRKPKSSKFIAGAVCPKCNEVDRIVVKEEEGRSYRLCVSCGFTDDKPETTTTPSAVLKGRLEKPLFNKTQAKKLNIIDLNKSS